MDSKQNYVFVIDEINRGNLSRIFGELMMLIEADKRGPKFSIRLTYSETADKKFYAPTTLHTRPYEYRGPLARHR